MNVTIYSTATCGFCKMLKKYLDDHSIKYTEKMADSDEKIAMELYEKSKQFAVPFTIIEEDDGKETPILGFDVSKFNSVLNLK
jgi:glutaredoxin